MDAVCLTFDIDWAPDFMIDFVAELLIARQIRATWFITHATPALQRLRQYPHLFELGIHPNFLPGSTHGNTPEAVLAHCTELVPESISVRTHNLVQSTPLLHQIMIQTPITIDVSLFMPHTPHLRPVEYHWNQRTLLRLPFFWEDDMEMTHPAPSWRLSPILSLGNGLKIFNFHPVHLYLNSSDMAPYQSLKQQNPQFTAITATEAASHVQTTEGAQTLLLELLEHLTSLGQSWRMVDIAKQWRFLQSGATSASETH